MAASIEPLSTIQKGLPPVKYNLYGTYPLLRCGAEAGLIVFTAKSLNWRSCAAQWFIRLLCYVMPLCTITKLISEQCSSNTFCRLQSTHSSTAVTGATLVADYRTSHCCNPWNPQALIVQVLLSLHGAAHYTHVLRAIRGHFSNF